MKRFALIAVLSGALWLTGDQADAQCGYAAYYAPVPVVAYRPVPYYAPPAPVVWPATYYTTRYRPLRGYVTRVNYGYAPGYYYQW